jgi:hypothetical protein
VLPSKRLRETVQRMQPFVSGTLVVMANRRGTNRSGNRLIGRGRENFCVC